MTVERQSIAEFGRRFRDGSLTVSEWTQQCLNATARANAVLNFMFRVTDDLALSAAKTADRKLSSGVDLGPLHGIPYVVADVIDVAGVPTTCGSRSMADHVTSQSAAIVERLDALGAIMLGKASIFEFALGSPGDDSLFPPSLNPWDPSRIAGATGGAAAILAGLASFAITPDTGGAARGSAAVCGVVGLKPTFGAISCEGIHPAAASLDHCGLIALNAGDMALLSPLLIKGDGLSTHDKLPIDGLSVGIVSGSQPLQSDMANALQSGASALQHAGAKIAPVPDTLLQEILPAAHTIYASESFAIYAGRMKAHPEQIGRNTRERLVAGAFITADMERGARTMARAITSRLDREIFADHDLLLLPAAAGPAPKLDLSPYGVVGRSGMQTLPFNVTGHPAVSVPVGLSNGLPLGIQIVGRRNQEQTVLSAAQALAHLSPKLPSLSIAMDSA
jgi:aspartyl-tRNA(Asn)/glutamyl-tRNA(Gln) amidotransferase subunit A